MSLRLIGGVLALSVAGVVAVTAGCAQSRPQQAVGNVTAEDCYRPLEQGIRDLVSIWDDSRMSVDFRDWLKSTRQEREELERNGGGNASIGFKGFSFGGSAQWSLKTLKELDARFERDQSYRLTQDDAKGLATQTANDNLVNQYFDCLGKLMNAPSAPVVLRVGDSSEEQVTFSLKINPDGGRTRDVRIVKILATGGVVNPGSIQEGGRLSSTRGNANIVMMRDKRPDGSRPEAVLWVFTDVQDVAAKVRSTPPVITKTEPDPVEVERRKREAEHQRRVAAERIVAVRLHDLTADVDDAGTDATFEVSLAAASGTGSATMPDMKEDEHERGNWTRYPWVDLSGDVRVASLGGVTLSHNNKGDKSGWKAQHIDIWARTSEGARVEACHVDVWSARHSVLLVGYERV